MVRAPFDSSKSKEANVSTVFSDDVEGLALGAVTVGQWDEITGAPTVVNTRSQTGAKSIEFNGSNGIQTLAQTFVTPATTRYMRRAVWFGGKPATGFSLTLMRVRTAGNVSVAEVRRNAAGQLVLVNASTVLQTSTAVIPDNAFVGIALGIDSSVISARYYANAGNDTVTEQLTGAYTGGEFAKVIDGVGNAANNAYLLGMDSWIDDDADWPSVLLPPPPINTGLKEFALINGVYRELTTYLLIGTPATLPARFGEAQFGVSEFGRLV
jgi:hypothetical protein